jgi:uncharacterized protein (TIGR02217 family)
MSFHDVRLPETFSKGSQFAIAFRTKLVELRSGPARATAFWPNGRRRFNVARGIAGLDDLIDLYHFYLARNGRANTFRVKDWLDYATNETGILWRDTDPAVTATDEVLVQLTSTTYQFVKRYVSGPTTVVRSLTHLVSGTTLISEDDVTLNSGVSVDLISGVATFTSAPSGTIKGGTEFDVHGRFGPNADEALAVAIEAVDTGNLPEVEVLEELSVAAYNHALDYGGSQDHGDMNGADVSLNAAGARLNIFQPGVSSLSVFLPEATDLPDGGPWYVIANKGSETLAIKSSSGTVVTSALAVNGVVELYLGTFNDARTWFLL